MMYFPSTTVAAFVAGLLLATTTHANAAACETAATFNDVVRLVNAALNANRGEICFHPFHVVKPTAGSLVLNRPISIRCDKQSNNDQCIIEGDGNQIKIAGRNADVTIDGFTFVGATNCAVRVHKTTFKTHTLVDCDFINNHGDFNRWRGGAIKTETGTSLTISSCNFESNEAAGGGAIYHRGDMLVVSDSSFANNSAKEGGAIMVDSSAGTEIFDSVFINNFATITDGGAIQLMGSEVFTYDSLTGSGNSPCIGVYDRSNGSCLPLGLEPDKSAFVLGELTVSAFGLRLSTGLSVKIIARADQRVPLTSPERSGSMSKLKYHTNPDGAAVFPLNDGGWIYMSNAENVDGNGGVFGVVFDSNGRIKDYVTRLTGTTRNCSGGSTPWNTWVSCEEHGRGQCWQVDPTGARSPAKTKLVEQRGGNFEAMAYDISDLNQPYFFVTEDHERGALRRFKPVCDSVGLSWNLIQLNGEIEYLQFNDDNTFQWTPSIDAGRDSAQQYYQYSEGISFDDGILSFVSKRQKEIFHLDLDAGTYTVGSTDRGRLSGGGSFSAGPDQIIQYGDLLYFTEDGGGNPGIYASDGTDYYTLFEARDSKFRGDETTGLAFSPDGTKLYVCIQEIGFMFEITRDDGLPFPGGRKVSQLRWHNKEPEE